ncbi:MAG: alkaline phosphatase family protein, partial [Sciscionella sp.]
STRAAQPPTIPGHVVVVMEENHGYSDIIGNPSAPYINSLAARGALFTDSHGVSHPSEGNYIALYSGHTYGLTDDTCGTRVNEPNLYTQLDGDMVNYSESLSGDRCGNSGGLYSPWHNATSYFTNVPPSGNRPFTAFPTDYATLPKVAFVAPNMQDDMHDGSVARGDRWLRSNLGGYAEWARQHNSLLILTWDEDEGTQGQNRIATIAIGEHVAPGTYPQRITHYTVLRTLESLFGLAPLGAATGTSSITAMSSRR